MFAVIAVAVLLARLPCADRRCRHGTHSIVVYPAFFLPVAATRTVLVKAGIIFDVGTVGAVVAAAGDIGPAVTCRLMQWSG